MPGGDGAFVVAHADGNMYVYEKASFDILNKISSLTNILSHGFV